MRTDKTKITVKFNKLNNKVVGYFPNDKDYPNESFVEDSDFGYIEITREESQNKPSQAIVNGNTIEAYVKPDSDLLQEEINKKVNLCKSYLSSTDWYVLREVDDPSSYPQSIKDSRIDARSKINTLEACTTIEGVNNIDITFS